MSRNFAHWLALTLAAFAVSIGHAGSNIGSATGSATASAKRNALWVYSVTSLPNPVTDTATRDALIQDSSASGVNAACKTTD